MLEEVKPSEHERIDRMCHLYDKLAERVSELEALLERTALVTKNHSETFVTQIAFNNGVIKKFTEVMNA